MVAETEMFAHKSFLIWGWSVREETRKTDEDGSSENVDYPNQSRAWVDTTTKEQIFNNWVNS